MLDIILFKIRRKDKSFSPQQKQSILIFFIF